MKIELKKQLNILGENTIIYFVYDVVLSDSRQGFKNFDIDDEKIKIDNFINTFDNKKLKEISQKFPTYYALSLCIFKSFDNVSEIIYETSSMKSIINRAGI